MQKICETQTTPIMEEGKKAFAKLRAEIEASVCHNRCGDADDLAKAIDDLIIQRINAYHQLNQPFRFK